MQRHVRFLVLIVLAALTVSVRAQEKPLRKSKVPAAVLKAFKESYPEATAKAYSLEKENGKNYYEVESIDGKTHRDLLYAADGKVIEIEESIKPNELPEAVRATVKKDFQSAKILRAERTTREQKVSYELVIRSGKNKYEASYSPDGKRLSKKELNSKQKDD